jgi:hypothetical protein
MKVKLLYVAFLILAFGCQLHTTAPKKFSAASGTPIKNGFLQGDFNGNTNKMTNLLELDVTGPVNAYGSLVGLDWTKTNNTWGFDWTNHNGFWGPFSLEVGLIDRPQGYFTLQERTNDMGAATNFLSFTNGSYTIISATACQVTGFTDLPTTNVGKIKLTLVNIAGTNWVLTQPMSVLTPTGIRGGVTATNGQDKTVEYTYDPRSGHTNEFDFPNY